MNNQNRQNIAEGGLFQDAEYIDEIQNAVTSRFARQTGSASTFPACYLVIHAIFPAKCFFLGC